MAAMDDGGRPPARPPAAATAATAAATAGPRAMLDAAALAIKAGRVRSSMPLPDLGRQFVHLDLESLRLVVNAMLKKTGGTPVAPTPTLNVVRNLVAANKPHLSGTVKKKKRERERSRHTHREGERCA